MSEDNARVLPEVDSLRYATMATVSRCGMVWYSADCVTADMCLSHTVSRLRALQVPQ